MLTRRLTQKLRLYLSEFPAVCLLGPRQVGKTTIATQEVMAENNDLNPLYLDLENPSDLDKLSDPLDFLSHYQNRLVILDEVQRAPDLFPILRGLIDERRRAGQKAGHFLLLGSASIDLLKQSSETLAGRIAYLEMQPFDVLEVADIDPMNLLFRGGFPDSLLASSEAMSNRWRDQFIATYLERDIPMLGPRIPAKTLRRFWTMLAHLQSSVLNVSQLARNLGTTSATARSYLDLMVDLLLVRLLPPYHINLGKRLVKSPKMYIRDSGLVHALLNIQSKEDLFGHAIIGASWEGHVIENLLRAAPERTQASYYRTATGVELDLVLEMPNKKIWTVEVKRSSAPKLERGYKMAIEDIQPDQSYVVYGGTDRYSKGHGTEVISLEEMAQELESQD